MADKTIALQIIIDTARSAQTVEELTQSLEALDKRIKATGKNTEEWATLAAAWHETNNKLNDTTKSMGKLDTATKGVAESAMSVEQGFNGARAMLGLFGESGREVQSRLMGIQNAAREISFSSIKTGASNFIGLIRGIRTGAGAMKIFRLALISTGIGALVVAIGGLVAWFATTEKGANKLKVIFAQVGAVVGVLIDRWIIFAKGYFNFFSGNFSKGIEQMTGAFKGMGEVIAEDIKLAKILANLRIVDEANKTTVDGAKAFNNKLMAESNIIFNDKTKSIKERSKALAKLTSDEQNQLKAELLQAETERSTGDLDKNLERKDAIRLANNVTNAKTRILVAKDRRKQQKIEFEKDNIQKANQRASASAKEKAAIEAQEKRISDAIRDEQRKRQLLSLDDRNKESKILFNKYEDDKVKFAKQGDVLIELKKTYDLEIKMLGEKFVAEDAATDQAAKDKEIARQKVLNAEKERLRKKDKADADRIAKEKVANEKAAMAARIDLVGSGFSTLMDLAKLFSSGQEEGSKAAFETNKQFAIADAIVSTIISAQKAYQAQQSIPTADAPVRGVIAAAIATASGLARVAAIRRTSYQAPAPPPPPPSSGNLNGGGNTNIDPTRFGSTIVGGTGRGNRNPLVVKNVISVQDINKANQNIGQAQTRSVVK